LDITKTLFDIVGLDPDQAKKYSQWEQSLTEDENPFFKNSKPWQEVRWWNTHNRPHSFSHLCYWKGGHSLINNIFEDCEKEDLTPERLGFWHTKTPHTDTLVIPYKDPLDRFISAFFTSYTFKGQWPYWNKVWMQSQNPKSGGVKTIADECYHRLDEFMHWVADRKSASGLGYDLIGLEYGQRLGNHPGEDSQKNRLEMNYDVHFQSVHTILLSMLQHQDPNKQFKLLGLNLDNNPTEFIFNELLYRDDIPLYIRQRFLHRNSANNDVMKMASRKWKSKNGALSQRIINNWLSNDYKLIDHLAKNSIEFNLN